jgi:hypothetical protein
MKAVATKIVRLKRYRCYLPINLIYKAVEYAMQKLRRDGYLVLYINIPEPSNSTDYSPETSFRNIIYHCIYVGRRKVYDMPFCQWLQECYNPLGTIIRYFN